MLVTWICSPAICFDIFSCYTSTRCRPCWVEPSNINQNVIDTASLRRTFLSLFSPKSLRYASQVNTLNIKWQMFIEQRRLENGKWMFNEWKTELKSQWIDEKFVCVSISSFFIYFKCLEAEKKKLQDEGKKILWKSSSRVTISSTLSGFFVAFCLWNGAMMRLAKLYWIKSFSFCCSL